VGLAAGFFKEITVFRPVHFADFGKKETSFVNIAISIGEARLVL
jgi:hypothetical protein